MAFETIAMPFRYSRKKWWASRDSNPETQGLSLLICLISLEAQRMVEVGRNCPSRPKHDCDQVDYKRLRLGATTKRHRR